MINQTIKRLGVGGVLVWLVICGCLSTIFIGEYMERPPSHQSMWKAGITCIRCVGSLFSTGVGITATILLIYESLRDNNEN